MDMWLRAREKMDSIGGGRPNTRASFVKMTQPPPPAINSRQSVTIYNVNNCDIILHPR